MVSGSLDDFLHRGLSLRDAVELREDGPGPRRREDVVTAAGNEARANALDRE